MGRKGVKKIADSYDNEFRFLLGIDPAFVEWRAFAAEWLGAQKSSNYKRAALARFFVRYLHDLHLDKRPASLLDAQFNPPGLDIPLDLEGLSAKEAGKRNGAICDFLDWVLREKFAQPDAQGHLIVPPHLRNPFARLATKTMGKSSDLEFRYVLNHDFRMEDWRALAAAWLDKQRSDTSTKRIALDKFLVPYVIHCNLERNPYAFLRRDTQKPPFMDTILAAKRGAKENGGSSKAAAMDIGVNKHAHDFLAWVLSEKLSVEDDNGHRVIPHEFHNPVAQLSKTRMTLAETLKTPLPYRYIKQLRTMLAQGPTFRDWTWAQQAIEGGKNGGDWFVVDSTLINPDDPDCVWRERKTSDYERSTNKLPAMVTELWSPVRAVALYLKLELPLRTFQVRMLDSGEADTWRYEAGKFVLSDSPLAIGSEKRPSQRGVFHRSTREAGAGFFINTNKTADINKEENAKGYTIPWTYAPALYWLEKLRNWQERYNPIAAATPWRELEHKHFGRTPLHQAVLDERSDVCFLFRDASAKGSDCQKPLASNSLDRIWYQLLSRLEQHCAGNGETLDDGTQIRFVDPDSKVTHYPLHALRVSLITAYVLEGGVPIPIVSKLIAGHARIIMTLYYTKAGKAHVTEVMAEADRKMLSNEAASHKRFLMDKTYQEIEQRFAFVSPDALKACQQQKSASGFILEDKGICPVAAGLCDVGGNLVKENKRGPNAAVFAPVPGYPQERNCIRCRFFLSGPAFLPGLQAHFNQISYEATECSSRYVAFEQEIQSMEDERAVCDRSGKIFTQSRELERAYQHYEAEGDKANKLLTDLQACARLITRSIEIARSEDKDGVRLVASGAITDIQYALTETGSEVHQLEVMCENAVIFPEVDASKATLRRSQILDAMLQMNGKPPIFFRLTSEQQLKVGNEVMKLIQARCGNLKTAVEFAEGHRMLKELGILDETVNLVEEKTAGLGFRQIMALGNTSPLMIAKDMGKENEDES